MGNSRIPFPDSQGTLRRKKKKTGQPERKKAAPPRLSLSLHCVRLGVEHAAGQAPRARHHGEVAAGDGQLHVPLRQTLVAGARRCRFP